jgi:UDP-N-acetylmuramoyl-tripeptide--D-alanyl-D-alanine ligase
MMSLKANRARPSGRLQLFVRRLGKRLNFFVLDWRARIRRRSLSDVVFVSITGSCGKTTTTKLIQSVLSNLGNCQACTNEPWRVHQRIRVREAVLSVATSTKFYAYETASIGPASISSQLDILRPHIGVVTTVGTDHLRTFRNIEAVALEKGDLPESLPPNGTAILNIDDPHVRAMVTRTRARVVTYGLSCEADIRGEDVASAWPHRLTLTVTDGKESARFTTRLMGEHWATSVLAAIACGVVCGLNLKSCAEAVAKVEPVFGRYSVHQRRHGAAYVLDSIKAPFWTIPLGIRFVARASATRKTIVLGTISDYSGKAGRRYRRIARDALQVADRVVFVGPHSTHVRRLRKEEGSSKLFAFETAYEASDFLSREMLPDELIYIKASRAADHLERIMLSQLDEVVCWRKRCRKVVNCPSCYRYRDPYIPAIGSQTGDISGAR